MIVDISNKFRIF